MADLFSTNTLKGIVQDLRVPVNGLAARYFNAESQDDTEEIHFDVDTKPRRMAPFVSPLVAGKVVQSRGFRTNTFKPAYIKDKRVFTPNRALKRAMGERIGGGGLSPEQRMQLLLVQDLQDQVEMVQRRLEWMAVQALVNGAVTVVGDDYPASLVDFGRAAGLTIAKANGSKWGDAGVKPLDDIQDWSELLMKTTGVGVTEIVMALDVWKVFRADADVKTRLDRWRGTSNLQPDAVQREGLIFMGMVDEVACYVYTGWADTDAGADQPLMPAGTVLFGGGPAALEGVRHFGAIMDVDHLVADAYYPKSWTEEDPSARYLLMQSAPLLVPYRVNAMGKATVR